MKTDHRTGAILTLLLSLLGAILPAAAANTRTSLPNLHVNALTQDSLGYIWVGTAHGLCRNYGNGYDTFFYSADDPASLPSNNITSLLYRDGMLWITTARGVAAKPADSLRFIRFEVTSEQGQAHHGYFRGMVVYDGNIYAYGYQGLYQVNASNATLVPILSNDRRDVEAAAIDPSGNLWIASGSELICIDHRLHISRRIALPVAEVTTMLTHGNYILLGTTNGVRRFNPATSDVEQIPTMSFLNSTPVNTLIYLPGEDQLLVGTRGWGTILLNQNLEAVQPRRFALTDIPSVDVTAALLDREGNLWIGTFDKGVFRLGGRGDVFDTSSPLVKGLAGKFVTRIYGDRKGHIWIGTRYNGLAYYNNDTQQITYFTPEKNPWLKDFPGRFVQELFLDSKGRLWVSIDNGLVVGEPVAPGVLRPLMVRQNTGNVVSIAEDSAGSIWIGSSGNGITIFDKDLKERQLPSSRLFTGANISRLFRYDNKHVLACSFLDNIYLIDIDTLHAKALDADYQKNWETAVCVFRDKSGALWIGTYDNGLIGYNPQTRQLRHFTDFKSPDILAIRQDKDGNLWCSSSYGIYHIDPTGSAVRPFISTEPEGNQFHEKCSYVDRYGNIYFGGNYGLRKIVPDNLSLETHHSPIFLTELNTLNKAAEKDSELTVTDLAYLKHLSLDYDNNSLSIGFAGLNYGGRLEYAYMLEGFDKTWIFPGEYNHAIYSKLPAGSYRFLVKAKEQNVWGDPVTLLEVDVDEAPWLHPLAKLGYALFVLLTLVLVSQLYVRLRLGKERLAIAEKKMEDERQLSQRKVNFFNNISHELRTPVTLIYAPVKFLLKNFRHMKDSEIENSLEYIDKNVDRLLTLSSQILRFRTVDGETLPLQVAKYDPVDQIEKLVRIFNIYAAEKDITISFYQPTTVVPAVYDSDKLEKIITNLLFNAVKYTQQNGHIDVRLEFTDHPQGEIRSSGKMFMEITISDDGVGIPDLDKMGAFNRFKRYLNPFSFKKEGGFGIGLNFVKSLVDRHHGFITWRANPIKGTTFCVDLPIEEAFYQSSEFAPEKSEVKPTDASTSFIQEFDPAHTYAEEEPVTGNAAADEERAADEGLTNETEDHERPKILVVEDKPEMAQFIASVFAGEADVTIAENGVVGLQKALDISPNVIISDVMMPLMNGYEMLARIKDEPAICHIPVLLLTAKSRDEDKIEGYERGADIYMEKPFNPDVLHSAIKSVLAKMSRMKQVTVETAGSEPPAEEVDQMSPLDRKFLNKLYAYINENMMNTELNVTALGVELGFSRTNFYRKIKALTGVSPNDLLRACRLNRAAELLRQREFTISEIADMTGFGSQSHFSLLFKRHFGVPPRQYAADPSSAKPRDPSAPFSADEPDETEG